MELANITPISDLDDPRIEPYANVRDRDLSARASFIVEGEVVVRTLLSPASRFRVRSLLLEERRVAKLRDALADLPPDVPVYVLRQDAMDRLVGFPIHRGILALADRGSPIEAEALVQGAGARGGAPLVAMFGLVNHDNVGGIFRSAAAFGVGGILVDPVTCDPLYRKAVRVSVGGALVVPFARAASEAAILDVLEQSGYEAIALSARGERDLHDLPVTDGRRRALLVGAEGPGLSERVMARAQSVRIDMAGSLDSLNASVACGIALFAITRGTTAALRSPPPRDA